MWRFYIFSHLSRKITKIAFLRGDTFLFEIGHKGDQKIINLMLISKTQTYLSDKMPLKKAKIKKLFPNLPSPSFSFYNLNFFGGHFVTKTSLRF